MSAQAAKQPTSAANDTAPVWDSFVHAKTADVFCKAWLAIVCQQLAGITAAAVLIEDGQSFVPIAVWPQASPELSRLSQVVEHCLQQKQAIIQASKHAANTLEVAYPVMVGEAITCLVVLSITGQQAVGAAALRHLHWSSAWLSQLFSQRAQELAVRSSERTASVLACTAIALQHEQSQQALFELVNTLMQRFGCRKVALGLTKQSQMRLVALSETASFEKNTALAKAYVAAMEEAWDVGRLVQYRPNAILKAQAKTPEPQASTKPSSTASDTQPVDAAKETETTSSTKQNTASKASSPAVSIQTTHTNPLPLHQQLLAATHAASVLSCPLMHGGQVVGVLSFESDNVEGFNDDEQLWLDAFTALIAPIIQQRQAAEQSSIGRLMSESRRLLTKLFGPRHLLWKAVATLIAITVISLSVIDTDYRVTAKTVIEGEVQRVTSAPFAGFIQAAYVRAGDRVAKGQPLAALDDRELRMEQTRWASERDQYDNKLRDAVAKHNLSDVQIMGAQLQQAEAQLALVSDKISRSQLRAPFDGIVVTGDLSQQIGAPVELGKELFTIAPLASYRVILQVDERDIRYIQTGQQGQLVMIGLANNTIPFTVNKVTPVATAEDGKNFFRVEALLAPSAIRLRPGMEGVGKITTREQQLAWVMFHPLIEWLSLMTWKWLP